MLAPDFLHLFVLPLERLRLEYAVTDSVAAMLYAEPRFTADIDIILNPGSSAKDVLPQAFPSILSVQSGSIDLVDIGRRVDALGLAATWDEVTTVTPS